MNAGLNLAAIAAPVLESARISLRPLAETDVSVDYLSWMTDPTTARYLESRFSDHDLPGLRAFVRRMAADPLDLLAGIFLREDGRHIGNIRLGPIDVHHRRATIGLLIGDRSCWGKGFATEAISVLTRFAFEEIGLHRLVAGAYADNLGSVRAFEKAGWQQEARLPDHWLCEGRYQDGILLGRINPRDLGESGGPTSANPEEGLERLAT